MPPRLIQKSRALRPFVAALAVLVLCLLPHADAFGQSEPPDNNLPQDASTLLYLPFDGSLNSSDGEAPTQNSGLTFEPGIVGQGVLVDGTDVLRYATAGNFNAASGTIEFWVKPKWNGLVTTNNCFFGIGSQPFTTNSLMLQKNDGGKLSFFTNSRFYDGAKEYSVRPWVTDQWHHVAVTWTFPGQIRIYVDGTERISWAATAQDAPASIASTMAVGSFSNGTWQANAVIDEFRISSGARPASEIAQDYMSALTVSQLTMNLTLTEMFVTWKKRATLTAVTNLGTREIPQEAATWTTSNPSAASVGADGTITALAAGDASITATLGALQSSRPVLVKTPVLPLAHEPIAPYLATPIADSLYTVPVVIVRFLPTADGVNIDTAYMPDYYFLNPQSLTAYKQRLNNFDLNVKYSLEEGSRFRGYKDASARPSVGYRVVDLITIYEPEPQGNLYTVTNGQPVYLHDLKQTMERIGAANYVNNLGVREFWIWSTGFDASYPSYNPSIHKPEYTRLDWESNMSSPVTGDISNSNRDASDLPVYDHTYLVYSPLSRRSEAEAVHVRGHQIEHMLTEAEWRRHAAANAGNQYFNTDMFWKRFVGRGVGNTFFTGRAGWTHMPPNTTTDYDYENQTFVQSDIEDWTPDATGQKKPVNAQTWRNIPYAWPQTPPAQRTESHWYTYWMQSLPGRDNAITFGQNRLTNWWSYYADWDTSIRNGLGLYAPFTAPSVEFSAASLSVLEGAGSVQIRVDRTGDASTPLSVFYETVNQTASDRTDYNGALGTLHFAPGEMSKTINVFITDDVETESAETFTLTLSNAVNASIGTVSSTTVTINDNETSPPAPNPVRAATFNSEFFVRQHYRDFFNRDPDAAGLAFWKNQIDECGDEQCREIRRINVSAAFFLSVEFQETGYLVYKMYQAAYGRRIQNTVPLTFREFLQDLQQVGNGVVVGQGNWQQQLEQNKQAYAADFVSRTLFAPLASTTPAQFVDTLNANTGGSLTQTERNSLVTRLEAGQLTRAAALREVAENSAFSQREFNRAFVLMQYFGYLRRNPNDAPELHLNFDGYNFWLGKLNEFGGNYINAEMVKAFITSGEYIARFGP